MKPQKAKKSNFLNLCRKHGIIRVAGENMTQEELKEFVARNQSRITRSDFPKSLYPSLK